MVKADKIGLCRVLSSALFYWVCREVGVWGAMPHLESWRAAAGIVGVCVYVCVCV